MKLALCAGFALVALLPVAAHNSPGKLERLSIGGTEHIRLEDWARANNFQPAWVLPKQELKLNGSSSYLVFTVDSARMSLNGIHVWLSSPIALHNGSAWIASSDLASSIQPILFPPRSTGGRTVKTIVIDPGHGGRDPGNHDGRQLEKKYTLLLAREVGDLLSRAGFKASLTRTGDSFVELPSRPELARRRGADLFISLHFNSADGPGATTVRGVEVYSMTPAPT